MEWKAKPEPLLDEKLLEARTPLSKYDKLVPVVSVSNMLFMVMFASCATLENRPEV